MRTERSVVLLEMEIRDCVVPIAQMLAAHGINPHRPYTHEDCLVDGAAAHRYIQPPRPAPREEA